MTKISQEKPAILGGEPVRKRPWPKWPHADSNTESYLLDVLHSGRWAISGMYNGEQLYERRFSEAFAEYHNIPYCVPTDHGTSALTVALEALNVGYGDEVLVPGVTWVACASSVAGIGAIPILVDVEQDTLCMSVDKARSAISRRTKAIMLVHSYCTVADLDAFVVLSEETGIPLIEDCSQAHGARWRGRPVGTFGKIGAFSMQDTKVLTCGEGGAVITNDPELYDRMQQLRSDGRRYSNTPPLVGRLELEEVGAIQGRNFCLSEFHAAILLDRLKHLDDENKLREQNGEYLRKLLSEIEGVTTLRRPPEVDPLTYFQFCIRFNVRSFGNLNLEVIRQALMEELNIFVEPIDNPLNENALYNPLYSPRTDPSMVKEFDPKRFTLPIAKQASKECLTIHHRALLGDKSDMEDIMMAIAKVKSYSSELYERSSI